MLHWVYRVMPLALALLVLPLPAQADAGKPLPSIDTRLQRAKTQILRHTDEARQRRVAIAERANNVFTLLASEMVLDKGQVGSTLATYMVMLERTRDPEVAERAVEIALSVNAIAQAQAILARWQQLDPNPSAAQKRMAWEMAVAQGDVPTVVAGLDEVLRHANEYKVRRIFLQMAQMSLRYPEVVHQGATAIHTAAQRYADMPEAMIADAIFSAYGNRSQDAVGALQRLAELDGDIRPATRLTLGLIVRAEPQILASFFRQTDINTLAPMWQSLYVDTLISNGQPAQAYAQLQKMLAQNPDADGYLQAAFLSVSQKAPLDETLGYLDKAYGIGTQAQKSRAAFLAATRLMDDKRTQAARGWAQKISAADMRFDKHLLLASIDAEEQRWTAAMGQIQAAAALTPQSGRFYDGNDLWRLRLFVIANQQQPAQALAAYNSLLAQVDKAPANPEQQAQVSAVLYQRGLLYAERLRQPQRAVADLRRYVALNPTSADGLNALGYTLLSLPRGNRAEATRLIQEAYQLDSQSAAINDSLGWAHFLNGDAEAALPYLQYAYRQLPEGEVAAHLGEVLWSLQRQDEARTVWREGLQRSPNDTVLRNTLRRLNIGQP